MPRPRRVFLPGVSLHIIQRGNNKCTSFIDASDCEAFLDLVRLVSDQYPFAVHGFSLMTTHYHMVATPADENAAPAAMQYLDGNYSKYFNRRYGRIGRLWNGPYRGIHILDERYWLTCLRYVEQNPMRAQIVARADAYRWSSCRFHTTGVGPDWLVPHPLYLGLGATPVERQIAYKAICNVPLTDDELGLVRHVRCQARYKSFTNPRAEPAWHRAAGSISPPCSRS